MSTWRMLRLALRNREKRSCADKCIPKCNLGMRDLQTVLTLPFAKNFLAMREVQAFHKKCRLGRKGDLVDDMPFIAQPHFVRDNITMKRVSVLEIGRPIFDFPRPFHSVLKDILIL